MDKAEERSERAHLIYEFERRAYPIPADALTIGRDSGSHLLVREPAVSRAHAEVRQSGDGFVLHPVGGPTKVNGVEIAGDYNLAERDSIEIGSAKLTFTRQPLPLAVSVVERAKPADWVNDISTRRNTIKHPILTGLSLEKAQRRMPSTPTLVFAVLGIAAALFLLGK